MNSFKSNAPVLIILAIDQLKATGVTKTE